MAPSECSTHETVKARFRPWLSGKSLQDPVRCFLFDRKRYRQHLAALSTFGSIVNIRYLQMAPTWSGSAAVLSTFGTVNMWQYCQHLAAVSTFGRIVNIWQHCQHLAMADGANVERAADREGHSLHRVRHQHPPRSQGLLHICYDRMTIYDHHRIF